MGTESAVKPWDGDGADGAVCSQTALVTPPDGVIPTVVIASTRDANAEGADPGELRGIVFHDYNPVEWYCLAPDEVDRFKAWAALRFPSVQIVTPGATTFGIICPPPPRPATHAGPAAPDAAATPGSDAGGVAGTAVGSETADAISPRDLVREDAKRCAPQWFVPATPIGAAPKPA
jgi:hypothetical protein